LTWTGSTGAISYSIYRSTETAFGPFKLLLENVTDTVGPREPIFIDGLWVDTKEEFNPLSVPGFTTAKAEEWAKAGYEAVRTANGTVWISDKVQDDSFKSLVQAKSIQFPYNVIPSSTFSPSTGANAVSTIDHANIAVKNGTVVWYVVRGWNTFGASVASDPFKYDIQH
jgi:hypothetical protein